jgi:hypothetical protein
MGEGSGIKKHVPDPDPEVKKALDPGSGSAKIRNTVKKEMLW